MSRKLPTDRQNPSSETLANLVAGDKFSAPKGLSLPLLAAMCQERPVALEMLRVRPVELWPDFPELVKTLYDYVSEYRNAPRENLNALLETAGMPEGSVELLKLVEAPVHDPAFLMTQIYREARSNIIQQAAPEILTALKQGDTEGFLLQQEELKRELLRSQELNLGHSFADDEWFFAEDPETQLLFKLGIDHLDDNNLGAKRQQLVLFRAPYGTGKTTFLMWSALRAAAEELNVVFFSLEDGDPQVRRKSKRMMLELSEGRVFPHYQINPNLELITPNMDEIHSIDDTEYIKQAAADDKRRKYIRMVKLTETVDTTATVDTILEHLETLEGFKADVCVVDYADRLADRALKDEKDYDRLRRIMVNLRVIAEQRNLAMLTAEQTNREGMKEKSGMRGDTSSGSFGKNFSPDLVLALSRTEDQRDNNTATLFIDKARGGKDGEKLLLSQNLSLGIFVVDSKVIKGDMPDIPAIEVPVDDDIQSPHGGTSVDMGF